MLGLPAIDVVVILLYFSGMIAIGVWCSRRVHTEEDFFLAGRRFGKLVQTFAAFGQGTSADNAVGVTTTTFVNGASGIWSSLLYLFATPVYWLVTPWLRRLRTLTLGDFFLERYGSQRMAAAYAMIGAVCTMGFIALGFSAMTKTIVAMTPKTAAQFTAVQVAAYERAGARQRRPPAGAGRARSVLTYAQLLERDRLEASPPGVLDAAAKERLETLQAKRPAAVFSHIPRQLLIWVVCLIVLIYAVAGGLEAAFLTDMIQGMFIILLSLMLIPFAWAKVNRLHGGSGMMDALRTIHQQLPEAFFEIFGSPRSIDFTPYYIVALSVMALLTVVVQPNTLVATASARDEYAARYGFTAGSFLKRFCTIFWGVFALAAIVLYRDNAYDSDLVWGHASRDLLGPFNAGLVGLMIACLMAALMSTVDCMMLTSSSLLTHNLYRPLVPDRSSRHYIWVGRLLGAAVVLAGAAAALLFDTILQILKFIWEINVMLAPAFWLGMKWRGANRYGAWSSIGLGALLFLLLPALVPLVSPELRTNRALLEQTQPTALVRTYSARPADVRVRQAEIEAWDQRRQAGTAGGARPEPLPLGAPFQTRYVPPPKSIFWTQGVQRDKDGTLVGRGTLSLDLVLLDALGVNLAQNPYALNETIRILIRTVVPFVIMIVVSLLTAADEPHLVDRFYAKMRTRVRSDPQADAAELALSLEDVHRYEDRLLFPGSQWELRKWNREDAVGFGVAVLVVGAVLGLMSLLVSLGS